MANFNFNQVILGGRLTADPELKTTTSGIPVTTFTVAVSGGGGAEEKANFFIVKAWKNTAEFVTRYFHRGSSICVTGRLENRSWLDKDGARRTVTEIVASNISFVDAKSESRETDPVTPVRIEGQDAQFAAAQSSFVEIEDDDLPF